MTEQDFEEVPELTDEDFARGAVMHGGKPARGRPKLADPKQLISMRLDGQVIDTLRASGAGWQTRANDMLRKGLGLDE